MTWGAVPTAIDVKARAIRFSTLEAICEALDCQPGDLIEYRPQDPSARPRMPSS
ncbi:MAG TPA: helix-turn-helix domain-containing protein [Actinotalea sp.]|jgi:DNA-binding Xre family transcriptional regulator